MGTKKVKAGALHGAMRGNLRQNRDRRYEEAVERQAKFIALNPAYGPHNLCEKGSAPNPPKADRKVIECVKPIRKPRQKKEPKPKKINYQNGAV